MTVSTSAKSGRRGWRGKALLRRAFMLLALPVVLVALWWFLSAGSTNYLNPALSKIVAEFWPTWFGGDFSESRFMVDVVPSFLRIVTGYVIALVLGVALGVMLGSSRRARAAVEPMLEFFRAIPPPVLIPVFMLFMGIGNSMKIFVIMIGCLWPILLNTIEGVRALDPVLKDIARSYRFSFGGRLRKLVLPGASPQIVTGARQALSIGIILMVISEMFAAKDGLGFTIVQFQRSFAIPQMWGGVILLGLLGLLLALIFQIFSRWALRWYNGFLRTQRGGA